MNTVTNPTILEQPIVGKMAVICIQGGRCFAYIHDIFVHGLDLVFGECTAPLLRVYPCVVQDFILVGNKLQVHQRTSAHLGSPATQFPMPALKDWSNNNAFMAIPLRLRIRFENIVNGGIV
jgi:hypothetical protein